VKCLIDRKIQRDLVGIFINSQIIIRFGKIIRIKSAYLTCKDIQSGARNVIQLIVHVTPFYYYKNT